MIDHLPPAAYIHIPFCRRRCYYCDFAISVVGDTPLTSSSLMVTNYVSHLCQEIKTTAIKDQPLQTIFFGGGTPSLLPVSQLEIIFNVLEKYLGIASNAEISIEIDPGTFDKMQLREYKNLGINRVSLGVQTFDTKLLEVCGRTHNLQDIFTAINLIKQANFTNFSLDLITGLPYQTIEHCQHSLETAISIAPTHLSCYDLVLEAVTAFGKKYQPESYPLPTDKISSQMYRLTQQMLTNHGYQHYEISNYAQSQSYQCRHNRVYWENQPYYGFGMSAASYVNNQRFNRPRTRNTYYDWVKKGAIIDVPYLTANDRLLETLMLGLRLVEGVNLSSIAQHFGTHIEASIINCLETYLEQNLVIINQDELTKAKKLKLSDPEGFLVSNTILATLFEKLDV